MADEDVDLYHALNLPPGEAVRYLRRKDRQISGDWYELWQQDHVRAATVAQMAEESLLRDTYRVLDRAIESGLSERQAAAELEALFRKEGWWGKKTVDGVEVQLGSMRRIKTIIRTNGATAFAAGRYQRQKDTAEALPYWRYVAVMDHRTRDRHRELHGKVFRSDDPVYCETSWGAGRTNPATTERREGGGDSCLVR